MNYYRNQRTDLQIKILWRQSKISVSILIQILIRFLLEKYCTKIYVIFCAIFFWRDSGIYAIDESHFIAIKFDITTYA